MLLSIQAIIKGGKTTLGLLVFVETIQNGDSRATRNFTRVFGRYNLNKIILSLKNIIFTL